MTNTAYPEPSGFGLKDGFELGLEGAVVTLVSPGDGGVPGETLGEGVGATGLGVALGVLGAVLVLGVWFREGNEPELGALDVSVGAGVGAGELVPPVEGTWVGVGKLVASLEGALSVGAVAVSVVVVVEAVVEPEVGPATNACSPVDSVTYFAQASAISALAKPPIRTT